MKLFNWTMRVTGAAVGAALVGALVAGNRFLDEWETLELAEGEGEFCNLGSGWRIHFNARGEGAPVILLHGFMDSLYSWRHNLNALAENRRVIALDRIGFGFSERVLEPVYSIKKQSQLLKEFLEGQGIDRASIIGHSMGGAIAAQFAYDFPDCVDKLVLEAAAIYLHVPAAAGLMNWIPPFVPRGALGLYSMRRELVRAGLVNAYGDASRLDDESVDLRSRALRVRGSAAALLSMLESPRESDLPQAIAHIQHPTLIIWGDCDRVVPLRDGRTLRRELPNARLAIITGAGHLPHEECADQVNGLLEEFLDRGIEGLGTNGSVS